MACSMKTREDKKIKKYRHQIFILFVILLLGFLIIGTIDYSNYRSRRQIVSFQLKQYANDHVMSRLNRHLFFSTVSGILVQQNNGKVRHFQETSRRLLKEYGSTAVSSIQLAPGGTVKYSYPSGSGLHDGEDLFENIYTRDIAIRAKYTGLTSLTSLIPVKKGQYVMYAIDPVYVTENGEKEFWGFSIATISVPELFENMGLGETDGQLDFRLTGPVSNSARQETLLETDSGKFFHPVTYYFSMPNGTWCFTGCWRGGWITLREGILQAAGLGIVIVLYLVYSRMKKDRAFLFDISSHDELTGMNNRYALRRDFSSLVARPGEMTVLFIDVDNFKNVNDRLGHAAGDRLLKDVAAGLEKTFGHDLCYRYGGDEFLVILPGLSPEAVRERVKSLQHEYTVRGQDGRKMNVTISGGYAHDIVRTPEDLREMFAKADEKLYEVKNSGKGKIL